MSRNSPIDVVASDRLRGDLIRRVVQQFESKFVVVPTNSGPSEKPGIFEAYKVPGVALDGPIGLVGGDQSMLGAATIPGTDISGMVAQAVAEVFDGDGQYLHIHDPDPELTSIIAAVVRQLPDVVRARRQALTERHIEALVDIFLVNDPLATAMPDLERDNAVAQADFLKRWPVLTAEDIAERAGHGSKNRSATATRWKRAGRIFAVRAGGREVYPAFQFKNGQPRRSVGAVLANLPQDRSGWQIAFWFTGANSWLDGEAPVGRLEDEVALAQAARREADVWMG